MAPISEAMSRTLEVLFADMMTLRGSPRPADLSSIDPPFDRGLLKSTLARPSMIGVALHVVDARMNESKARVNERESMAGRAGVTMQGRRRREGRSEPSKSADPGLI